MTELSSCGCCNDIKSWLQQYVKMHIPPCQLPVLRFLLLACLQDGVGDLQLVRGESAEPQLAQAALPKQDVQNERPDLALAPSMSAQVSHVSADCHLAVMHLHLSLCASSPTSKYGALLSIIGVCHDISVSVTGGCSDGAGGIARAQQQLQKQREADASGEHHDNREAACSSARSGSRAPGQAGEHWRTHEALFG